MYYNVKMRAEKHSQHISGAERIVEYGGIQEALQQLSRRALQHPHGEADFLSITVRRIDESIRTIPALPVSERASRSPAEARSFLAQELQGLDVDSQAVLDLFYSLPRMRGAALVNVQTLARMEPDQQRGIRASSMDYLGNPGGPKNHLHEALCLASKVAHSPCIVAELCMSDDPDYTTGYFASKGQGYIRLPHIKEQGDPRGGRLFLFSGSPAQVPECIHYMESVPVLIAVGGM